MSAIAELLKCKSTNYNKRSATWSPAGLRAWACLKYKVVKKEVSKLVSCWPCACSHLQPI